MLSAPAIRRGVVANLSLAWTQRWKRALYTQPLTPAVDAHNLHGSRDCTNERNYILELETQVRQRKRRGSRPRESSANHPSAGPKVPRMRCRLARAQKVTAAFVPSATALIYLHVVYPRENASHHIIIIIIIIPPKVLSSFLSTLVSPLASHRHTQRITPHKSPPAQEALTHTHHAHGHSSPSSSRGCRPSVSRLPPRRLRRRRCCHTPT